MGRLQRHLCAALEARLSGEAAPVQEWAVPLWNAFTSLAGQRQYGEHGPQPIAYRDIEAWSHLMRVPLEPHHVEAIVAMDRVWLAHAGKRPESRPAGNITAELFDARFG